MTRRSLRDIPDVKLVIATDDERVASLARSLHCAVALTSPSLHSGTDRAFAALAHLSEPVSFIVNVQGDAPFAPIDAIGRVIGALQEGACVATPVVRLAWRDLDALRAHKVTAPFSGATCIRGENDDAIWFSKQIIPMIRDEPRRRAEDICSPILRHVGLYGYRREALERFVASPPSSYEQLEGLEQLRFFALGIPVRTVEVRRSAISMGGIDTPEDVALAERLIAELGDPFGQ